MDSLQQHYQVSSMKRIVFATTNKGKAKEAAEILGEAYEIILPADLGIFEEAEESGGSFRENSEIKARFIYERLDRQACGGIDAVFADDSGLEVDALDGEPGLYTARYAGEDRNFRDNMDKLLHRLRETGAVEDADRKARFVCCVTVIGPDGKAGFCEGCLEGRIAQERHGDGGFGYDPVFIPDDLELQELMNSGLSREEVESWSGRTLAEIPESCKNLISHRYKALKAFRSR